MRQLIQCRICNKEFKIITPAHLKSHDITVKEYREKFNCHVYSEALLNKITQMKKPKEVLDNSNAVQCQICLQFHRALNLHLRYRHNITPDSYVKLYPGAPLYANCIKDKMSEKSFMKKQKGISLEERLGKETADRIKKDLSAGATARQTGTVRSQQYKNKMRETWENKRTEWVASIAEHAKSPEVRKKQSEAQKRRIARDGYHLARGKETSLEKLIREILINLGYTVIKQKGTQKSTLGTTRFFDIFVPELNLIIEADGEYWHRSKEKIYIDRQKTSAALKEGYEFLRISDIDFNKKNDAPQLLLLLLQMTPEEKLNYSNAHLDRREFKLLQQESQ